MKICYVGDIDSIHTRRWACYFAERGHSVDVVSPWTDGTYELEMQQTNVSVHILSKLRSQGKEKSVQGEISKTNYRLFHDLCLFIYRCIPKTVPTILKFYIPYSVKLRKLLKMIKPDLLHGWYLQNVGILAALSDFKPLVISPLGSDVVQNIPSKSLPWIQTLLYKYALNRADLITATSNFLANETARFVPKGCLISVVPFGVDTDQFHPKYKMKADKFEIVLGYAKRLLDPRYGTEYLVKALGLLVNKYPNMRLLMAGEGAEHMDLKKLTAELGLQERVTFMGHIPHNQIPSFLGSVDIFIMPSVCLEAFGVAAVEASAMQLPVVATKVGGIPEVVVDGVTGILVDPRDEKALAEAIATLVEDEGLREKMGKAGRAYVLSRYRWEDNAAKMAKLYGNLLAYKK